ncbi:purine-nucleoside phosphorylase [Aureimonas sp. Leaf324]|jgi:purine-nucleoside phosphorylase|uniref:purine-nucleoside phosphorylase n=1 Tax=Aureimonas sp. Leaf324 TaxID=1736336 RepID=UPI0006F3EB77|nr:purine-nucleoside phosphorylase [Aureimonas sp. Leaf324]KQQ84733.1 purine nucleoside phosphorylase [Aureimonas sp. Leaf324]
MSELADALRSQLGARAPRVALILGSGLGALVDAVQEPKRVPYSALPGMPVSAVSGHAGEIVIGWLAGIEIVILSGRIHYYEAGDPAAMRPALEALKAVGIEILVLTNAAGSVNSSIQPGEVMLIEDHIAFSGRNPLIGEPTDARFVGMTTAYDEALRTAMLRGAVKAEEGLHRGVYMWFSGPSFETPAEIRMAKVFGADAVGMSTVPETILARFLGLRVVAASVITNMGAGITGNELSHTETKEVAPRGGARLARILAAALPDIAA